jgi:hypothetical protein
MRKVRGQGDGDGMAVPWRVMGTAQVDPLAIRPDHPKRPKVDFDWLTEMEDYLGRRCQ